MGQFNWISDTKITVPGGYYEGNQSSSSNVYTVEKRDGKWTVTKNVVGVVSSTGTRCIPFFPSANCVEIDYFLSSTLRTGFSGLWIWNAKVKGSDWPSTRTATDTELGLFSTPNSGRVFSSTAMT
jgi:hypothetical protein